jgi:hypothetical protein
MLKWIAIPAVSLLAMLPTASNAQLACAISTTTVNALQAKLAIVVALPDQNGGLFKPNEMWSAIVDRTGKLCSVISSSSDAWPGSRAIAIAKATTANGFSNNKLALSTANLYAPTQPGGSLYGLNNSNLQPGVPAAKLGPRVRAGRRHHFRRRRGPVRERADYRRTWR